MVQETCSVNPEKPALIFEDGLVLTRREFLSNCEHFAAALRHRISTGDRVKYSMRDGWYHTGDLVSRDKRGFVYFHGRSKNIIRRSGENMAAAEIEAVLRLLPKIVEAAVIAVLNDIRGEEAKAYVPLKEAESPQTLKPTEIIDFCRSTLAAYKVPRYIEYRTIDFPERPL